MKDNYIMIKGHKIPLSDETVEELVAGLQLAETQEINIFSRANRLDANYYANDEGLMQHDCDYFEPEDTARFNVVNYCTDYDYLVNRTDREILHRKMEKFSIENGMFDIDWTNPTTCKYHIYISFRTSSLDIYNSFVCQSPGTTYFKTKEVAQQAIEKFESEIRRIYNIPHKEH